eukprot:jgi/Psemu1/54232/gm1.54232_g
MVEEIHLQLRIIFFILQTRQPTTPAMAKKGHRLGVINYSRTEVLELLHALKAILPVGPEEWAQEVKLVKRVKWLIKGKEGVGDREEPYNMVEGYQNNMEDKEYISSEEEHDDSDDDNIPPIPLGQPSQTMTQPTQQSIKPTQQSTEPTQPIEPTQPTQPTEPTQPTQPPLRHPSQPTQEPIAIKIPARIVPRSWFWSASSSSSPQRFVPSSSSPSSTPWSKRQKRRNTTNVRELRIHPRRAIALKGFVPV